MFSVERATDSPSASSSRYSCESGAFHTWRTIAAPEESISTQNRKDLSRMKDGAYKINTNTDIDFVSLSRKHVASQ